MSRKKVIGIAIFVGAILVLAGGAFTMLTGHTKSGIGLIALGVISIAVGLATFFSRSAIEKVQLDREWM